MKKVLLLTLALCIGFLGYSQIATMPKALRNQAVKTEYQKPIRDIADFSKVGDPTVRSTQIYPNESTVGTTQYDLFTNTFVGTNLTMFEDGTMAAAWTFGLSSSTFPDRGTGYNYYDGSAWGIAPAARIESVRAGFGRIAPWGPNGEIVGAHNGTNLQFSRRATKGTGAWTEFNYVGVAQPTWPKIATSGENHEYLHVVYHSYSEYAGMPGAMLYCRSMDGGDTWIDNDVILEGTGVDYYYEIQAETFFIAARENTVAILVGGAWNDMFIMKSTDNGDTWNKIMVWEHPYPFFDFETTLTDTVYSPDNSAMLAIGPDGRCHVTFGINRTLHDAVGTTYSYFPWIDGIGYWNEDMQPFSNDKYALSPPQYEYPTTEMVEDVNYIGYTQDVDEDGVITLKTDTPTGFPMAYRSLGVSTMPTITVDDQNRVFIVFASTTETFQNTEWNFKKIWARAYAGGSWGPFYHVTQDIFHIFDESIYPTLTSVSDDENIYFLYQVDGTPGLALDEDHPYQENSIIVCALPKEDVLTGIDQPEIISQETVSQNYPNPFNGTTTITVYLKENANLSLEVSNMMGQQIMLKERGDVKSGTHYFTVDASDMPSGIYFYTVKADNSKVTKKMVVR
jgi:hypothetical protein